MLLIPNEDMPSKCEECPCYDPYVYLCHVVDEDGYNGRVIDTHGARQEWCPLIEVPKHGKWIWDDEGYHCSECFFHAYGNTGEILSGDYHFCPNCGADMREAEGDDA